MTNFLQEGRAPLILASASATRRKLLEGSGLTFSTKSSDLDEAAMRTAMGLEGTVEPSDVAEVLARGKAEDVSAQSGDAFVIGGDQVMAAGGKIYGKPQSMEDARARLLELSGKSHQLHTAVVVATGGVTVWAHTDVATLTMRRLSPEFVGRYLAAAGEGVLGSVGAYQIESLGIQLFEKIEGDFFSILGLPLLALLDALRRERAIEG
ncbi:septum formation inhibitor Maf [Methyloceanibacter stevinii]|uniref:Nucleoside triphosphate pyrophosphatase n=1 Tax=Methyloceanibacter stevinii TaxID=1774970 RepID=A0A1E3VQL1_9HYPH|nr:Maf family nucleotide pyrophosphatase [Methyloceanibacter stevinii]ODR95818.1 septum formation inhibitor Maf [Methyloceanibacter stevinii]